jgi:hypothetical protein
VHRTAVYAPEPRQEAMKMLALLNEKDFAPQAWVPRDIASSSTLYANVLTAFDNFDSLFDELIGGGEKGTWKDALYGLKSDPNGPQLDLRKELVANLGHRITLLTDYHLPITTTSERLLLAVEATDAKAVQVAMEKWMKNDPAVKRHIKDGQIIWEMVEEQAPQMEAPEIDFGSSIPSVGAPPAKKKTKAEDEESQKKADLLPHMAVTVWQGKLIIASHIDFLLKVVRPAQSAESLAGDVDYELVSAEIRRVAPKEQCVQVFSRSDEAYRPTYELIRQNKMPESESMLGRLLNAVFAQGKRGATRRQKIDGAKLPDFEVVRRYLGPAGFKTTTETEGWFLKGFMLSKNAEGGASAAKKAAAPAKPAAKAPAAKPEGKSVPSKPAAKTDAKKPQGSKLEIKKPASDPKPATPKDDKPKAE